MVLNSPVIISWQGSGLEDRKKHAHWYGIEDGQDNHVVDGDDDGSTCKTWRVGKFFYLQDVKRSTHSQLKHLRRGANHTE